MSVAATNRTHFMMLHVHPHLLKFLEITTALARTSKGFIVFGPKDDDVQV